ncbi:MAG: T9SS type A sorting domain-containing protein, partial [Flavobacteriales bacterium]|nr:T9SS type A sorting domain-containing protein [Flavobacteriales bacterium]
HINKIVIDLNGRVYAATNVGLFYSDDDGNTWTQAINSNKTFTDVEVSTTGEVFASADGGPMYTSTTGNSGSYNLMILTSVLNYSTSGQGAPGRVDVAIAPTNESHYYALVVNVSEQFGGLYHSLDKGTSWTRIFEPTSNNFHPMSGSFNGNGQGYYDCLFGVDPNNEDRVFIGGVHIWTYNGNWTQAAAIGTFGDPFFEYSGFHMHSDKHTYAVSHVDPNLILFGHDGGISKSLDGGFTFFPANRGYNVTQFYGIGTNEEGWVIGGSQDNSTQIVNFSNPNFPHDAFEFSGNDGFRCEMSDFTDVAFSTFQYGAVFRGLVGAGAGLICGDWAINSNGEDLCAAYPLLGNPDGNFYSTIALWESINDPTSQSNITFVVEDGSSEFVLLSANGIAKTFTGTVNLPQASSKIVNGSIVFGAGSQILSDPDGDGVLTGDGTGTFDYNTAQYNFSFNNAPGNGTALYSQFQLFHNAGDVLNLSSNTPELSRLTSPVKLDYTLPSDLSPGDTVKVQDPVQSLLAFGASDNNIYIMRDAINISKAPEWWHARYERDGFIEDFDNFDFAAWNQVGGTIGQGCTTGDDGIFFDLAGARQLVSNPMKVEANSKIGFDFYVGTGSCDAPDAQDTLYFETRTTIIGNVNNWTTLLTLLPEDYEPGYNRVAHTFTGVSLSDSTELRWRQGNTTYSGANNDVLGINNIKITTSIGTGSVKSLEFSKDGNHLFVGTFGGEVIRISGLNNVYSEEDLEPVNGKVSMSVIFSDPKGRVVAGMGLDPNNADNMVVTLANYGYSDPYVYFSSAATTSDTTGLGSLGTFGSLQGDLPFMPVYDGLISYDANQTIVLGTDNGVFVAELADVLGGNGTWNTVSSSHPLFGAQIFEVIQQSRDWFHARNTGEIYLGTHGSGFWKSSTLVSVPEFDESDATIDQLLVYPNPMSNEGTIEFELSSADMGSIRIMDINGRLVQTIPNTRYVKGKNVVQFNASELKSGNYFALLELNGNAKVAKFIVQH